MLDDYVISIAVLHRSLDRAYRPQVYDTLPPSSTSRALDSVELFGAKPLVNCCQRMHIVPSQSTSYLQKLDAFVATGRGGSVERSHGRFECSCACDGECAVGDLQPPIKAAETLSALHREIVCFPSLFVTCVRIQTSDSVDAMPVRTPLCIECSMGYIV